MGGTITGYLGIMKNLASSLSPKSLKTFIEKSFFARSSLWTFSSRMITVAVGLIASIIIARYLGPEGRGIYGVALTIGAVLMQFGNLGLHSSNTYFSAKDERNTPYLIGNTLVFGFLLGLLVSIIGYFIFTTFPNIIALPTNIMYVVLAWVPVALVLLLLQNIILGRKMIREYNLIEILQSGLVAVGIVMVTIFGKLTPSTALVQSVIAASVSLVIAYIIISKTTKEKIVT